MGPALPSKAFHTAQPVYAQVRLEVDNAQLQRMGWLAAARFSYSRRGSQGEVFELCFPQIFHPAGASRTGHVVMSGVGGNLGRE